MSLFLAAPALSILFLISPLSPIHSPPIFLSILNRTYDDEEWRFDHFGLEIAIINVAPPQPLSPAILAALSGAGAVAGAGEGRGRKRVAKDEKAAGKPRGRKPKASSTTAEEDEDEEDEGDVLLCDGCDAEVSLASSGLDSIPEGDFFCAACLKAKAKGSGKAKGKGKAEQGGSKKRGRGRKDEDEDEDGDESEEEEEEEQPKKSSKRGK